MVRSADAAEGSDEPLDVAMTEPGVCINSGEGLDGLSTAEAKAEMVARLTDTGRGCAAPLRVLSRGSRRPAARGARAWRRPPRVPALPQLAEGDLQAARLGLLPAAVRAAEPAPE